MSVTLEEHCSAPRPPPRALQLSGSLPRPVWLYASFTSQELWFDFCLPLPHGDLPLYLMSRRIEGHGGPEAQTDLAQVMQLVRGEAELESSPTGLPPPTHTPPPPHPPTVMPPLGTPRQVKQTSGRTVVLAFAPVSS